MPGTHSTPFLRQQAVPVSPIKETEKILEDLNGLTLTVSQFKKNGYRMEAFTECDLHEMLHCKTCGLRVSKRAERRRRKATKDEKEREAQWQVERITRRDEILEKKLQEVLPTLKRRKTSTPRPNGFPGPSASALNDFWGMEYGITGMPLGAWVEMPNHCVVLAPATSGTSRHLRAAHWRNEADQWVKFVFALDESELVYFDETRTKAPRMICQSHPGRIVDGRFTCCDKRPHEPGCIQRPSHGPIEDVHEIRDDMKLFETPSRKAKDQRPAIALDCEMGISARGESELIWIAAVDFFTGEVLLDSLVYPKVPMKHLSTRYSGVTWSMLRSAKNARRCLNGRDEARRRLFQWVGPETIVATHGGRGDLLVLRWIHRRVVDTFEVEGKRKPAESQRALAHLTAVHLNKSIQKGKGHDCLEDTVACRDLAKWYVDNLPAELKVQHEEEENTEEEEEDLGMDQLRLG